MRECALSIADWPKPHVASAALSREGTHWAYYAPARGVKVEQWDDRTDLITLPAEELVSQIAFAADGHIVTLSVSGEVTEWSSGGLLLRQFQIEPAVLMASRLSPDGSKVAICIPEDDFRTPTVIDVRTQRRTRLSTRPTKIRQLTFSRDGSRLASLGAAGVAWVDAIETRKVEGQWNVPGAKFVALDKKGERLLIASANKATVFEVASHRELRTFPGNEISAVAFSPVQSDRYALADKDGMSVWEGTRIENHSRDGAPEIGELSFSDDGTKVLGLSIGRTARLWSQETGGN